MEAHYIGFSMCYPFSFSFLFTHYIDMWMQAVQQAGTTDVDAVRMAVYGQTVQSLSGYTVVMNTNHHLSKPVMIGKIRKDGQFDIVSQTPTTIKAEPWSPYLAVNASILFLTSLQCFGRMQCEFELLQLLLLFNDNFTFCESM